MKTTSGAVTNLIMGVLLLISVSYSAPSAPRHKAVIQTEWTKIGKQEVSNPRTSPVLTQQVSDSTAQLVYRLFDFHDRMQVFFRLNKLSPISFHLFAFAASRMSSHDDDDYFVS